MNQQDREYLQRFGGFAYPTPIAGCTDGSVYNTFEQSQGDCCGATLLDWFARDAMHAEMIQASHLEVAEELVKTAVENDRSIEEQVAVMAYDMAEAMLAERKRRGLA